MIAWISSSFPNTAINLSPQMYLEFVKPYDDKVMKALGNASMHYCGRGDQWIHEMAKSEQISGYNFGHVPNLKYGMEFLDLLKPHLLDKGKPIISYVLEKNEPETMNFKKYHTGITYETWANDLNDAKRILDACRSRLH